MEQIEYSAIIAAGLPVRIMQCQQCGTGTIYRKDHWFQCPSCGALSTAFGGCFKNLSPYGGSVGASEEWKELCAKSDEMLEELLELARERIRRQDARQGV